MPPLQIASWSLLGVALVISVATDILSRRILDVVTYPLIALALGLRFVFPDGTLDPKPGLGSMDAGLLSGLVSAAGAMLLLTPMAWRGNMGWGDVKLAGLLGLHLAWLGWGVLMVGAVLGVFAGGLAGVALLVARRVNRRSSIAYGPAMLGGAFVAILWGQQIADWYLGGH